MYILNEFFFLGRENTQLGKILRDQLDSELISETLEQLKRSPTGLDNVLKNTVSFGIAFHHAGLTMDERDIIEGSFRFILHFLFYIWIYICYIYYICILS